MTSPELPGFDSQDRHLIGDDQSNNPSQEGIRTRPILLAALAFCVMAGFHRTLEERHQLDAKRRVWVYDTQTGECVFEAPLRFVTWDPEQGFRVQGEGVSETVSRDFIVSDVPLHERGNRYRVVATELQPAPNESSPHLFVHQLNGDREETTAIEVKNGTLWKPNPNASWSFSTKDGDKREVSQAVLSEKPLHLE
jgi:hypothetical protein